MFQVPLISSMGSRIPPTGSHHLPHSQQPCLAAHPAAPRTATPALQNSGGKQPPACWGLFKTLSHISWKQTAETHQLCRWPGPC